MVIQIVPSKLWNVSWNDAKYRFCHCTRSSYESFSHEWGQNKLNNCSVHIWLEEIDGKKLVSPFWLNQYVKLFLIFLLLEGGEVFHLHQTGPPRSKPIGIGVCAIAYNHSEFVTIGGMMSDDSVHGLVYRWKPNDTFTILEASINSCIFTIFPSPPSSSTLEFLVWVCLGLNETQCVESGRDAFLAPHLGWQVPLKRNVKKILGTPQMGHHPQFHWYSGHSIQFMILLRALLVVGNCAPSGGVP